MGAKYFAFTLFLVCAVGGFGQEEEAKVLTNEELTEVARQMVEWDGTMLEMYKELAGKLDRQNIFYEGVSDQIGSLLESSCALVSVAKQQTKVIGLLEGVVQRHDTSLKLAWLVRFVLLPFSLMSAGAAFMKLWDTYELGTKVKDWFRRKFGKLNSYNEKEQTYC